MSDVDNQSYEKLASANSEFSIDEFTDIVNNNAVDKQEIFDRFLTYRRRMARLAAIQALYLYDFRNQNTASRSANLFSDNSEEAVTAVCQEIIDYYKNVIFTVQEYGWTKKNKKIDEAFMFAIVNTAIKEQSKIDSLIQQRLVGEWTVAKLDLVLRAIIRCAMAELLLSEKIEKAVLCSEYTNLASEFCSSKEVGFINGIVDKLYSLALKSTSFANQIFSAFNKID